MAIITPQNCYQSAQTKKAVTSIVRSTNSIVVQFDRTTGNGIKQFCFCLIAVYIFLSLLEPYHSSHSLVFFPQFIQNKIQKEGNVFIYSS